MNRERQALITKIQALKRDGAPESDRSVKRLRRQVAAIDRRMLIEKIERLQR